ncbi:MAG: C40 family peptidase [Sulfurovaceae bacterium]|nr:C40 family peptidase [Sulfurovaceae bacterium]
MKSNKSIKFFILMLLTYFTNAQATIAVIKLQEQTNLPYCDKESNTTGNMSKVDELIWLAKSKLGSSYEPTKAGPDHFDCSGFVYYLFTTIGISIPRTSIGQSQSGKKLTREELEKGDVLFFDTFQRNHINHSGVYLGDGKFIHSTSGKAYGVIISDLDKGFYLDKFRWGVRIIENVVKSAVLENEGN